MKAGQTRIPVLEIRSTMKNAIAIGVLALVVAAAAAVPGEDPLVQGLRAPALPEGWKCSGDPAVYDSKTLFELIDGEAELYFPYGFKRAIAVTYASTTNPDDAVSAEVYEVGSLLDAFGVYSNYRDPSANLVKVGADGFAGSTEIMFYQDRYFVKMRLSGKNLAHPAGLMGCAQAITKRLSRTTDKPPELDMLKIANVVPGTEKYIAQSLLGYDFFPMGLVADVGAQGASTRVFIVMEVTPRTTKQALDKYVEYLQTSKAPYYWKDVPLGKVLAAKDPLHKGVLAMKVGGYVIGVASLADPEDGLSVLQDLHKVVNAQGKARKTKPSS
jgi:hypothetical protein